MPLAPCDDSITLADLTNDPYRFYKTARNQHPVVNVTSVKRTMLTKAEDTKFVKNNWELFSSDDPGTPMKRAFQAHTLMRKDGDEHMRERNSMTAAFSQRNIRDVWVPLYEKIVDDYIGRLPRGETIDLFHALAAPVSARCLSYLIGLEHASDNDLCRWSQTLIHGAGNFGWVDAPFTATDIANNEINSSIQKTIDMHGTHDTPHAISAMLDLDEPMDIDVIRSNIKIVIGGGINEPRDAMLTAIYGLLTNPDQLADAKNDESLWQNAFEEAVRWVAPIQASSRLVLEDTEIRGFAIPKGDVVMTIQASANHDEDLYEDGHLYNLHRPKQSHQAFGNGPHFCLGTHIARRTVADIVLPRLFDRFAKLQLDISEPVLFRGFGFRGPINLPVRLH